MRIPSKIRDLHRAPIYGEAVGEIVMALGFDSEVKYPAFLFTNAFIEAFKRGELDGEYASYDNFEQLAWAEHYEYDKFIQEVVRRIPGTVPGDFPKSSSIFYILRKRLPRALGL